MQFRRALPAYALGGACLAALCSAVVQGQMATADRIQSPGWWPTKGAAPRGDYLGAAACASCHPSHAATQPTTAMARTAMPAHESGALRANAKLKFTSGAYGFEIATSDRESVYTVSDGERAASAPLAWAFGLGNVGQSFLFEKSGGFHEARVSYYDAVRALDLTPGRRLDTPRTLDEAAARRVNDIELRRCFGCHTTASTAEGVFDAARATPGLSCEACHGPGRRHVDAMKARRMAEGRANILNPARLEPADSVDFCGACHATFWDVTLANEKGIAALRSQPYRLASSRCWDARDKRSTCVACHNPHRPLVRDPLAYDARCLACHVAAGAQATADRPGRACKVGKAGCTTCHMPKYEVPELHHTFTDHLIRISKSDGGD